MIEGDKFIVFCEKKPDGETYFVYFAINKQLSDRIKILPKSQRTWNPTNKSWELSAIGLYTVILSYRKSEKIFFNFMGEENKSAFIAQVKKEDETARKSVEDLRRQLEKNDKSIQLKVDLENDYKNHESLILSKLKDGTSLYKHQIIGVCFLEFVNSALLSLEMGLGKTAISIAYAEMRGYDKVFVITPNSLKFNFYNEVAKFTNSRAYIVGSKKNEYELEESKYIIFNYEYFNSSDSKEIKRKLEKLGFKKTLPDCIICDESHRLKNTGSNTFKNFKTNFSKIKSKVFLSGTPAPNKVAELYSVLNQISPLEFATKNSFYQYYCGMEFNNEFMTWELVNPPKLDELFQKLSPHTFRKRKIDVLDLPEKTYQKVLIEMSDKQADEYADIERGVVDNIIYGTLHQTKINALTIMSDLRQYTAKNKIKSAVEIIERIIEEGDKVVIVDMYKESLYQLHALFPDISSVHTGDQTVDERNAIVNDFQNPNGKCKIFLGSIQTCNYGLTLTASNKLFIITLPFSVGEFDQVSDRLHRIGQTNNVTIYLLIMEDTIDEKVFALIESKRKEINKAIDNIDTQTVIGSSVIHDLVGMLKSKYVK